MRPTLAAVLLPLILPATAAAQTAPVPLPPLVTVPPAEPSTGAPDAVGLPTRLSLLSAANPNAATSGCRDDVADETGGIVAVQPATSIQLTTRLTLQAVSNLGCPGDPYSAFDTGMGGAITYAAQLGRRAWLVFGAGAFGTSTRRGAAVSGVDVVWKGRSGRTTSVGVGTTSNGRETRFMPRVSGSF